MTSPARTRVRKPAEPLFVPGLNDDCCKQVTIAGFRGEGLVSLVRRHTGPFCNGYKHHLSIASWRQGRYEEA